MRIVIIIVLSLMFVACGKTQQTDITEWNGKVRSIVIKREGKEFKFDGDVSLEEANKIVDHKLYIAHLLEGR